MERLFIIIGVTLLAGFSMAAQADPDYEGISVMAEQDALEYDLAHPGIRPQWLESNLIGQKEAIEHRKLDLVAAEIYRGRFAKELTLLGWFSAEGQTAKSTGETLEQLALYPEAEMMAFDEAQRFNLVGPEKGFSDLLKVPIEQRYEWEQKVIAYAREHEAEQKAKEAKEAEEEAKQEAERRAQLVIEGELATES